MTRSPSVGTWKHLPVALYRTAPDGTILDANREFVTLLGYPNLQTLLDTPAGALYADSTERARWKSELEREGVVRGYETQMRRADGSTLYVRETTRLVRTNTAEGSFYEGLIEDITAVREAQRRLRESETAHEALFQNAPAGLALFDLVLGDDGRPVDLLFLMVNHAFEQLTGLPGEAVIGQRASTAGGGLGTADFIQRCGLVALTGEVQRFVLGLPATGRSFDVSAFSPGSPRVAVAVIDITLQKEAEEEHARLTRAIEQAAEAIVITDPDARIVYVNPAFEQVSGYSREEVLGQNPRILKSGEQDDAFYQQMWQTLLRGEAWTGRLLNRRKDGTLFEEIATISPVRDATSRIVNYVAVKRDVTKETRLETQLAQALKMEAVGRLAGGIAHDFNNLLGVIIGYADLTERALGAMHPLTPKLQQITKAGMRGADLTRKLLAFSRQQVLEPRVIDLNEVVSGMEKMLGRLIGEDVRLRTRLASPLGNIKADPGQIEQVIMNLAVNARDALPKGGDLTIETSHAEIDEAYAERHPPCQPGAHVVLSVTDTGTGMDAATRQHIFEPFFTTKEQGKGTGLGLSTVYGIVEQSGGHIWVYSELGHGTTFKIFFPRVSEARESALASSRAVELLAGDETVLLVEDEPGLREMIEETLTEAGYTVLVATDGLQALGVVERHEGPLELIISDVVMPGMGGPDMLKQLARHRPGLRVLFISGYPDGATALTGDSAYLSKPFATAELLTTVRAVLDK